MPFDRQLLNRRLAKRTSNGTILAPQPPRLARLEGRLSLVTSRTEGKDAEND
jgi:hypothetical protein